MNVVLVGAGQRGRIYADYIQEKGYAKVVGVVEPNFERRAAAAKELGIADDMCFDAAEKLWAKGKIADVAIIASMDNDHFSQVMTALDLGYNILLEKPISPSPMECIKIEKKAKEKAKLVVVCHVLRYTSFFSELKKIVDSQRLGKVINVNLNENVGNFHIAHSFVRGNWRKASDSSPIIMQKSCHDMDILHWLIGANATKIASFGSLSYFKAENAPNGSAQRCCECKAEENCRFSAYKAYLPMAGSWPATVVSLDQSQDGLRNALLTSQYGKCVYHCDNDVCDSQIASISFENGVTAGFTLSGFTNKMSRTIRIMCEDGEISGDDFEKCIKIDKFSSNPNDAYTTETIHTAMSQGGHGGGDIGLIDDFFATLTNGAASRTAIESSVESHIMAFAAEESRKTGETIDIAELKTRLESGI